MNNGNDAYLHWTKIVPQDACFKIRVDVFKSSRNHLRYTLQKVVLFCKLGFDISGAISYMKVVLVTFNLTQPIVT